MCFGGWGFCSEPALNLVREAWTDLSPHPQRGMRRGMNEVVVGRQQGQLMPNAKLRQQRIDGADLNTGAPARIGEQGQFRDLWAL